MKSGKILIVDDNSGICELLKIITTKHGYECVTTTSSIEAIEILEKENILVVITDLNMPVMDGQALLCKIKRSFPKVKVFVMSADLNQQIIMDIISIGAEKTIDKLNLFSDVSCVLKNIKKDIISDIVNTDPAR